MKIFNLRNNLLLLALLFFCIFLYDTVINDDLQTKNITSTLSPRSEWSIPTSAEQSTKIDLILNQSFTYLSEGGQSSVFSSADNKYVLKLFKFKRFRPNLLVSFLPDIFPFQKYKTQHAAKREKKLNSAFNGYKLAHEMLHHECGLIFVQLNPSNISKTISVIDKSHKQRTLNLKHTSFILQERGEILSEHLTKLLNQKNIVRAKKCVDQIFDLHLSEYQKGIYDLDHGIMHNIGCIEDRIFHLDVGKFVFDEKIKQPAFHHKELIRIASKLQEWFWQNHPEHARELTDHIEMQLSRILAKKFQFSKRAGS